MANASFSIRLYVWKLIEMLLLKIGIGSSKNVYKKKHDIRQHYVQYLNLKELIKKLLT